jgi:hypothetical protein
MKSTVGKWALNLIMQRAERTAQDLSFPALKDAIGNWQWIIIEIHSMNEAPIGQFDDAPPSVEYQHLRNLFQTTDKHCE